MISVIESSDQPESTTHNCSFKQKLQDIIENINIAPDLTISYRDYEPLAIAEHLQDYLQQLSLVDRDRYLAVKLQQYLYDICSCDDLQGAEGLTGETVDDEESDDTSDREEMANYVKKWSRTKFYQQLTQHNHGKGYRDTDWLVVGQEADYWQVTKNDLTLYINPEKHLNTPPETLHPGELVSIQMPSNLVDHGFYIAVGNAGSTKATDSPQKFLVAQLYFNVAPEGAIILLDHLTQKLNTAKIPFDFKIAYDESDFDDLDATVLDFKTCDFELVYPIVKTIYQENQVYFNSTIPFFCQPLAAGLGFAEKPRSPNFPRENIGQHHCGLIAKALVELWQENSLLGTDKWDYILDYLSQSKVDLEHFYLNSDSTEIYKS
ncbi:hypothetical protein Xen7305DRAFT_00048200 [Xenococcus sp. PCC 7305]|uniref:T3SS effector HopA1 family protein n=1 Tax=Xenococcus sp. PCC 7305 TaxID=102125 RepID=UPI0002AC0CAF|nr:T3SS effector HopA1 family protein [Xenococcus sp. PCC 7305]ELS05081.1 hypothetical protein Xen7305DRAFT_00048200 [Xenococcus sp. PCC 7305]